MPSIFFMFFVHLLHFSFITFSLFNSSLDSAILSTHIIDMTCSWQIFSKCFFDRLLETFLKGFISFFLLLKSIYDMTLNQTTTEEALLE